MVVAAEASTEAAAAVMEEMADANQTSKPALETGPAPIHLAATPTFPGGATATSATPRNEAGVVTWAPVAMPDFLAAEEEAALAAGDAEETVKTAVSEAVVTAALALAVTAALAPVEETEATAAAAAVTALALEVAAETTNTDLDPEEDGQVPAAAQCEAAVAAASAAVAVEETDTDRTDLIRHFKNSGKSKKEESH